MVTTIIRLPKEEHELYKEIARARGVSLAEYFRKAARKEAKIPTKKKSSYSIWNLGTKVVFKGGPKDGSVNTDKYLYEFEEAKLKRFAKRESHKK